MSRSLKMSKATSIVVDTAVLPGLTDIDAPLCLILRETKDSKLQCFQLEKDRPWDLVIVPNPEGQWRPNCKKLPARRIENVGWIFRANGKEKEFTSSGNDRSHSSIPTILIVAGGGGTKDTSDEFCTLVTCLIESVRYKTSSPFKIAQVIGPRTDPNTMMMVADELIQPGPNLPDLFSRSDIVISTAGYNSVLELAETDVPTLLIPIERTYDDQYMRARRWGTDLGLAHNDLEQSARWLAKLINKPQRRLRVDLESSGAAAAANLVRSLVA